MLWARLSGIPQSRGQAFTADNQKRSYGFKAKPFIPILFATMLKKYCFSTFLPKKWGRGQRERMYTLLHPPTSLCGVDYLYIEVARYISSSVAHG
jgi:hypothetical protein